MTMKHDKFSNYPNHISMYACRDENEFQQVLPVSSAVWLKLVKNKAFKSYNHGFCVVVKLVKDWFTPIE